ncbi:TetR/AcrR family transcriptional regulator [Gordonia spumicola]|nr:TetR/AcrR family transcriptional regulator [Gordonia spumicola]
MTSSTRTSDTRTRLVESAASLFSKQGYGGTGIKTVLADAEAPYGSLYHFFPGGKEDLGVAALRFGGERYRKQIEAFHPAGADPVEATERSFQHAADLLAATDYEDACPIATMALEAANTHESLRVAAAEAFESWLDVLAARFAEAGMTPARAREVAVECFCLMEGAVMLARTTRSPEPLHVSGRAAASLVTAALA